jgi:glycosyltransferase involved in cell wall biosynthesis
VFETHRVEKPELHLPANDASDPILSIVVPALNEEITIGQFVDWCQTGIRELAIPAEILIVDSSQDRTREIALAGGARVLSTPRRGLGRAYIDALPYIRGKYVILGDADCTYDFRVLKPFIEKFEDGYEFIMGSRFKGSIEQGAMPPLHRYFGTPLTTWILNLMYGTEFSDIHCGMRGLTREAFVRIGLVSQSWEYASEMVLKSVHLGLRRTEVPVRFLKDMDGRTSHHVRAGWFSPWLAGWINLKAMFVFGASFFLRWPGIILLTLGLIGLALLALGPIKIGPVALSLNAMLLALVSSMVGLQLVMTSIIDAVITDGRGSLRKLWLGRLSYTRSTLCATVALFLGVVLLGRFIWLFLLGHYSLEQMGEATNHLAVIGLSLILGSIIFFTNMLVLHAASIYVPDPSRPGGSAHPNSSRSLG